MTLLPAQPPRRSTSKAINRHVSCKQSYDSCYNPFSNSIIHRHLQNSCLMTRVNKLLFRTDKWVLIAFFNYFTVSKCCKSWAHPALCPWLPALTIHYYHVLPEFLVNPATASFHGLPLRPLTLRSVCSHVTIFAKTVNVNHYCTGEKNGQG